MMKTLRAAMPPELRAARSWYDRSHLWERIASRCLWFIYRRLHTVSFGLVKTANKMHPAIMLTMRLRHRVEARGHERLMIELRAWRAKYDEANR